MRGSVCWSILGPLIHRSPNAGPSMIPNVAWKDGLPLLPHHFQRTQQALEERILENCGEPASRSFGFSWLEFDERLLRDAGIVALRGARGSFQDGTSFDASWLNAPPTREMQRNGADEGVIVHVAIPLVSEGSPSMGAGLSFQERMTRYAERCTGQDVREIGMAVPGLVLKLASDANEGYLLLPAARIVRTLDGGLGYDGAFIPALLDIHASGALLEGVNGLLAQVQNRLLAFERQNPSLDPAGIRSWLEMLHLRTCAARLEHLLACRDIHPERLYAELVGLAGGLAATRGCAALRPSYSHVDLDGCFRSLFGWFQQALGTVTKSRHAVKPLRRESQLSFGGAAETALLAGSRRCILALATSMSAERFVPLFQQQAKVGPRSKLQTIILSALKGIDVQVVPSPDFYHGDGRICLELVRTGMLWSSFVEEGEIGVYVPQGLEVTDIELLVEGA